MDTVKNIYFKLRNIFVYSFINPKLREKIGFRFISYLTQSQGWFLWLDNSEGVYDLFTLPGGDDNSANFLIKYYPSPDEAVFKSFPARDQEIRTTYTFKEGAPLWEDREKDLADQFIIGRLDILWEDDALWVNLNVPQDESTTTPMLKLSHALYRSILRALCIFNRTAPALVLSKTIQEGSIKTEQFLSILLPTAQDKPSQLSEICGLLGVNLEGAAGVPAAHGAWVPLYVEDVKDPEGINSPLVDRSWFTLPDQTVDIVPKDLHI